MPDITLLGATGFVGSLVADYLSTRLPGGATWAIAGRDAAKLDAAVARLSAGSGVRPSIIEADVGDEVAMRALAEDTRVLITTVGPYLQYGEPAVRAAAEAGIAYVDLTGEPQFVDEMWLKYHEVAQATGARIVHACGFDSIPYDLGVLYTVSQLPDDAPITVRAWVRSHARLSGGTFHSAVNQLASVRESARVAKRRRGIEPRPDDRSITGGGRLARSPLGGWQVPLPTIDPQIVLRSARALPAYGRAFRYEQYAQVNKTTTLAGMVGGAGAVLAASQLPLTRSLLLRLWDPGEGPSVQRRAASWFTITFQAETEGETLTTRVSGGDPGYTETAKMLSESALCLAFDELPAVAGQLTTAVAMGDALIRRLRTAGIAFDPV